MVVGLIWLGFALVLEVAAVAGGDASILYGWLLLVWTAPFSVIYHVWAYDAVRDAIGRPNAQIVGALFEVVLSFFFWFVLLPRVWRWARQPQRPTSTTS